MAAQKKTYIGVGTYIIMNLVCMVSIRSFSVEAPYGLTSAFYYIFAAIFFLVPMAFIGAELSTGGWKQIGSVFCWTAEPFGKTVGLLTLFLMLMACTTYMPTNLIFASTCLADMLPSSIGVALSQNKWYTLIVVMLVFWVAMYIALSGLKNLARISKITGLLGTIIPIIIFFFFTGLYVLLGNHINFMDVPQHFFPNLSNTDSLVLAGSVFLFYSGIELNAIHVNNLKNPRRDYPITMLIVALLAMAILIFGTLCVATLVPVHHINIVDAIIISFKTVFGYFHLLWLEPVLCFMMAVGVFAQTIIMLSGPSKAVFHIAKLGFLPPVFQRANKHGMQQAILLFQGAIVTILALLLLFCPSVQSAFQLISQLSVIAVLAKYSLLFAAGFWLRIKKPNVSRGYRVPGGLFGMGLCSGLGIIACVWALFVNFHIPTQFAVGSKTLYLGTLFLGIIIIIAIPFALSFFKKDEWRNTPECREFIKEMNIDESDLTY